MDVEWFNDNYIENKEQIEFLISNAERYHTVTMHQLLNGCYQLRKISTEKELLETHIKMITGLTDLGIDARVAGIKIREALLDTKAVRE